MGTVYTPGGPGAKRTGTHLEPRTLRSAQGGLLETTSALPLRPLLKEKLDFCIKA